jgi:PPOX class probable F420-dependent enzyme
MKKSIHSTGIAALEGESYVNLATFRRDGRAVETPVWFAERSGKLYVFSEARAGKVKRLRNDERIRIAPCDVRGKLKGTWIDGRGRRVADAAVIDAAYEALLAKYGLLMRITNFFSRLTGRIDKRAILELEI